MAIQSRSIVTVSRYATVLDAIHAMAGAKVGSVVVVDDDNLVEGIFSERDVMLRVVLEGRDPAQTQVDEVMTSPVVTISSQTSTDDALQLMLHAHIRHLPIVDYRGHVREIVSMRSLLEEKIEDLTVELDSLGSYIAADGIGG
ncbi:MAG TPA: CBS domain-containing protein [Terriglobia bacterium]|nr:CBS domain-containing protein [Terriglobia bacterium]